MSRLLRSLHPLTLWLGLAVMLGCTGLMFLDLHLSDRGAVTSDAEIIEIRAQTPPTLIGRLARFVAVNITALGWIGYILFLEGLLAAQGDSPVRRRPHHFTLLCLASVLIWCLFDWINFYGIGAWDYLGMPVGFIHRFWGYLIAFAAIVPAMLMSGQVLLHLRLFDRLRTPAWRLPGWVRWISILAGAVMIAWPLLHPDPITTLTLWVGLIFLLDPINLALGRPSMFRDWQHGWWGRTLAAFAGGLICGLLWEFWNYWALAKWTYDLPFLGPLEEFRYFEMPLIGMLGFIPFGLQCWVIWQTIRIAFDGLAEPLPDEKTLL